MIKKISFLLCLIFSLLPFSAIANDLTIYTYSSFNSEWGPGPKVFPLFEKKCSCKLKIVTLEDTGQLLARFLLEQKSHKNKSVKADILLGLNDTHLASVKKKVREQKKQGLSTTIFLRNLGWLKSFKERGGFLIFSLS